MKRKKTISLVSALIMAGMQLMATTQAYALQTTFASDLSASCGYRNGDVVDTEVVNFLAVAQQYSPKGTILSWNNPDDSDAESIKLFKNGVQIETDAEWDFSAGAFNKIGVEAFSNSDVFTLKLKKDGVEKTYKADKVPLSATAGDWKFSVRDDWYSSTEPINYYANGGAFLDTSTGFNSSNSLKMVSNKFQPTESGSNADHDQNVSNDADITAVWSIPADQGELINGEEYQLRYKVKTHNAGRLYVYCSDDNRWKPKACNQHISRNEDWVTKGRYFTKSDKITSITFTIPVKTDAIWIDDIEIGYEEDGEFIALIREDFEVDASDYEPVNFIMAPGVSCRSVSWVNPNVQNISKIELWRIEESGDTLITDDLNTSGGARQAVQIESCRLVKGIFYFDDGKVIEMFAAVDNTTLYGTSIPNWGFGLNQQGDFKYNPAVFRVDETISATDDGTASAKFISNHESKVAHTFISAFNKTFNAEEGKRYEFSVMLKAEGAADNIELTIGSAGLFDGQDNKSVSGTSGSYNWKKLSYFYTPPSEGQKQISINIPYAARGFWIDDMEMYEVDENNERISENLIMNGDISDYSIPEGTFKNLKAVGGDRKITLSWKNDTGYDSIWIYEKVGDEWFWRGSVSNATSSITFTNLGREQEYTYKLTPVTKFGVSRDEEIISAETKMLDYEIIEPVFVGAEHLKIGENTLEMTVKNNKVEDGVPVEMLIGIYKDNVLKSIVSDRNFVEKSDYDDEPVKLSGTFEIGNDGEYEVRVMVIDSRTGLNSYFDMYTFRIPTETEE